MDAFSILTGGTNLKKRKTQESKRKEGTLCLYSFLEKNQHCHQADQKESTINVESEEKITSSAPTEEEIKNFQRLFRIRVSGDDVPDPIMTFSAMSKQLQFPSFLLKNLEKYGFETPTPVQIQAIPISAAGRDLFVCSPTGSGKTLAFIIPMLADLKKHSDHGFRALIVTPVNELSKQIYREIKRLTHGKKFRICHLQRSTISNINGSKYDILISTPLMALRAILEKNLNYSSVRHLVLDEGDRLFDHEFLQHTSKLISFFASDIASDVKKSLFSATIPSSVETLSHSFMVRPVRVIVWKKHTLLSTLSTNNWSMSALKRANSSPSNSLSTVASPSPPSSLSSLSSAPTTYTASSGPTLSPSMSSMATAHWHSVTPSSTASVKASSSSLSALTSCPAVSTSRASNSSSTTTFLFPHIVISTVSAVPAVLAGLAVPSLISLPLTLSISEGTLLSLSSLLTSAALSMSCCVLAPTSLPGCFAYFLLSLREPSGASGAHRPPETPSQPARRPRHTDTQRLNKLLSCQPSPHQPLPCQPSPWHPLPGNALTPCIPPDAGGQAPLRA
ncbi:uncharacterized protein T551_00053 [Pneumocystis jirovecii RU7]|uniref:RNA helicase n=1 Tax=Pneumocystis jirovecii (strain RU7) TaxID=1408657 RepID=A0A0W4ZW24_PNEJ7|nr:uncharacterized protein T551_00053 [Pneumocystis jirovecii RU7]KTW32568.1 hypothetical protein T551_00053 [Pneumocystis jirovecii RU7]